MRGLTRSTAIIAVVVAGAAACGGSSSGGNTAQVKSQSGGSAAVVSTHSSPLGTYLTDAKGRTLYHWEGDTSSTSSCSGPCAAVWAPYKTSGTPKASGSAKQSMLGTTARDDGSTQVTYADHPLYYYVDDQKAGDMEGEGSKEFGALWTIVAPNGTSITSSGGGSGSSGGSSSPSSSGGGYSWG